MPSRSKVLLATACALTCFLLVAPHAALADEDHVAARKLRESGEILSLEKIAEHARTAKSGEILETELDRERGRYVYEVEILDQTGQVWELKLDAKTGDLIDIEIDARSGTVRRVKKDWFD
jgi:uncharacterized membrane protein YkoI